jgi:hypothetical protein
MRTNRIKELVEDHFDVDLSSKTRRRTVVHCRFLYYHLAYNHSSEGQSFASVGKTVGGFDHATVLYGVRQYENLYKYDKSFRNRFDPFLRTIDEELSKCSIENTRSLKRQIQSMRTKLATMQTQLEEIL